ncbi:hypothetical protein [Arenibaculum sp.]|jgi:hypothetical protein|uniref:hypothetical protein n=1 Tax=Arenibaculum sp. TaxID=2865862 RepID=UPI002E14094B|nr:hypothetical protein [Arenibaculum sp.]
MMESDSSGAFGVLVWRAPKAEGVPNPKTVRTTLSALPETPVVIPKKRGISRLTVFKGPMRDSHWEIECEADPGEESRNQGVKYIKIDLTDRSYRFYYNSAKIKGGAGRFARPRTSYIVDPPVSPGALYSIFSTIALENGPWRGLDEGYNCQTFVDYFLQALGATQV